MFSNLFGSGLSGLGVFEFDYLGDHQSLDLILINAKVRFYEKGLHISTGSTNDNLFVKFSCINGVTCTENEQTLIDLKTTEGIIKLKAEKKDTVIDEFKKLLRSFIPENAFEYVRASPDNLCSFEAKRIEKLQEEQERRVEEFVRTCGGEDDKEIELAWEEYLKEHLQFPFEAEIIDELETLEFGDIVKVIAIEGTDNLYGIIVKAKAGRNRYSLPLCTLEPIEKKSKTHPLVDDYCF